ncbi:MAG: hypothetical protein ACFFFH_14325 [Candidatus Thorarchaeota archaeon]
MDNSAKIHNDELMKLGYQLLEQCANEGIPCFLWGGGAIYHMLGGRLNYRKMSDLEFFLPKKSDHIVQAFLEDLGFIPYTTFNNMQNMSHTPRREFYRPNRELTDLETEEVEHGRKSNINDAKFQKVELFVDGIKMCWTFNFKDLPSNYKESLISPPGFQLALKANAIHSDDFDLKDVQDISSVVSSSCCGKVAEEDTIFKEPRLDENISYSVGTRIFRLLSQKKHEFPSTIIKNFSECLKYPKLAENGRETLLKLIEFLKPLEKKDLNAGMITKARKEKPRRVDARTN